MIEPGPVTPQHVEALASGSLSDVLSEINDIELKTDRPLSDDELKSAVDSFFDILAD